MSPIARARQTAPQHVPSQPTGKLTLFEVVLLLEAFGEGQPAEWGTVGWTKSRPDADFIAESFLTRESNIYSAAQIWHGDRLVAEHHRATRP
ncbi:hypothetical protein AB0F17_59480 [Nonomuraea sp. NPDC026600]|uniref:hypothetical protein n=1 Tax=Nonomuraea sp. NPDC026600 TaxID=3155363 RepID=UPI003401C20D